jgi:ribosomal protein S18 acetylase RimI-like enzyme
MLTSEGDAVLSLIVAGLTERWGKYSCDANPDLERFPRFYEQSIILVAVREVKLVGVGILHPVGSASAQIVRMSVARECRREGIGTHILRELLNVAAARDFTHISLETTASWESAVRFYESRGFVRTRVESDDQYFELRETAA